MEVAISNTPFQTQVHEWQQHHPSPVAEAHPIENHWIKGSFNTYGKMVTNNFLTPDGTKHTQKKQMEILQARTKEGGALQVVKSTTSQSISSRTVSSSSGNKSNNSVITTGCDNSSDRPERPTSLSLNSMTRPYSSGGFARSNSNNDSWDGSINRAKSQSNEDLVGQHDNDSDLEMNQAWNRISRIRRSFQYPSPSSSTPKTHVRPLDFPSRASVDVNKIRQELESICGANKVNKSAASDDGDFVALDSILKGAAIEKPEDKKRKQIVTSETLQNIRNSLRRLEDDSLYKDSVLSSPRNSLTVEDEPTKASYSSASPSVRSSFGDWRSKLLSKDSSLANSVLRRKSYGFERLEQMDDKMESSTDSGLGGSSPTAERKRNSLLAISKSKLSPTRITLFNDSHLISLPKSPRQSVPASLPTGSRFDFDGRTSIHINGHTEDDSSSQDGILDENGKKSTKRVEFCKTEIHFTPDSGRVNIVETDEKPPPTNNFRRRRRGSGTASSTSSTTSSVATTVTDSQFSRFMEKDEIQVAPDMILNKSLHSSVDLSPLNNILDAADDMAIRGILKNKPVKPKQYHLGENLKDIDSIWGVKLNPIFNEETTYKNQEAINSTNADLSNSKVNDFGYSTKIDFTFKNDAESWNEGAPVKNVLSRSYNSSFVEYKKPGSGNSQSTSVLAPDQELKSISLVKNTIRLGDSPSKFEIIETEIVKPEIGTTERGGSKYEFERLSSVRSGFAPITQSAMSSQKLVDPVKEKQLKRDLDEAFKDLMNVSATLREMGRSTETTSDRRKNSQNTVVIKQHNTFPSIRNHSSSSASHSISTIASNNWSSYTSSSTRQSQKYESLSDFGCETSNITPKTKPIPKPRHFIGTTSVSPSPEKVIHAPLVDPQQLDTGKDTVDLLGVRQKNVVKTIQMQFEALSHQRTVIPDSNSELNHSNSNKMFIELYSPTNSIDRKDKVGEKPKKRPVPVPRTIMSDSEGVVKPSRIVAKSKAFEQLAFKSGARQLKPTELVYFGILAQNDSSCNIESRSKQQQNSSPNSPLLSRNRHSFTSSRMDAYQPNNQLRSSQDMSPVNDYFYKTSFERHSKSASDETDRRHSDTNSETFEGNTSTIERINRFERTIRENLIGNSGTSSLERQTPKSPKARTRSEMLGFGLKETSVDDDLLALYDRSHDYKRDEKALAELTKAADEIMDTVKKMDEEESRRKSRSHHHQQYMEVMETINEKPSQAERRSSERVIYSPRRISRDRCSSLSSASSQESLPSLRKSPGRQQINRIPLRRNSSESIPSQASLKQSSNKSSNSTRECRRMLRTASREVVNSSSEDLATPPVKVEPPRRVRRIKVVNEVETPAESLTSESKTQQKQSSSSSSRRQKSDEKPGSTSRGKVYTHRLKKVDDISIKPSSSSRRHTTKSRAQSTTIRSSKSSL